MKTHQTKTFQAFMREAVGSDYRSIKEARVVNWKLEDLQNIYNASQHLDFEKWKIFFADLQKNSI